MASRPPQFFIAIKGCRSKTEGNSGASREAPNDNWIGETSGHHRYCTKDLLERPVEMMLGRGGETGYKRKGYLKAATRFPRFYDKLDTDRRKQAQQEKKDAAFGENIMPVKREIGPGGGQLSSYDKRFREMTDSLHKPGKATSGFEPPRVSDFRKIDFYRSAEAMEEYNTHLKSSNRQIIAKFQSAESVQKKLDFNQRTLTGNHISPGMAKLESVNKLAMNIFDGKKSSNFFNESYAAGKQLRRQESLGSKKDYAFVDCKNSQSNNIRINNEQPLKFHSKVGPIIPQRSMGEISGQIKPVSFQNIQINVQELSQQRKKKIMLSVPPNEDIKLFVSNQFSGRNSPAGTPLAKELISQRVIGNDYADLSNEMGDEDTGSGRTTKNV
jgi:hypothetical protein